MEKKESLDRKKKTDLKKKKSSLPARQDYV
jgi:hypothetical protein